MTSRTSTARTLRFPRPGRLALVVTFAAAVAVVPGSQALAASHLASDSGPTVTQPADAIPGQVSRGGKRTSHGTPERAAPTTAPTTAPVSRAGAQRGAEHGVDTRCARRSDLRTPWPFGIALHGEQVIETKDGGVQAVTLQRGLVQAVTDTSVTIVSKDGFVGVWTLSAESKVFACGRLAGASALVVGQPVAAWGSGPAATPTARFVMAAGKAAPSPTTPSSTEPSTGSSTGSSTEPAPTATGV